MARKCTLILALAVLPSCVSAIQIAGNFSILPVSGVADHGRHLSDTDLLHLHFESHGLVFDYDLVKAPPAISPMASVVLASSGKSQPAGRHTSYRDSLSGTELSLTLMEEDGSKIDGVVLEKGSGRAFHIFFDEAFGEMVVEEDVEEKHDGIRCAAPRFDPETSADSRARLRRRVKSQADAAAHLHLHSIPRKLVVEKWSECYDGEERAHVFDMGIAVDYSLFANLGSKVQNVEAFIAAIVDESNLIYETQLNIRLQITDIVIADNEKYLADSWNTCDTDMGTQLTNLRRWNVEMGVERGLWHLLTNCHPPPGVVGLAYTGVLCNADGFNVGVTSKAYSITWKIFAHEVGHNFGAKHSFEEGAGKTGGIMDYGDGKLNGEYQFNTKYRKDEICSSLQKAKLSSCSSFEVDDQSTTTPEATKSPTTDVDPTSKPTTLHPTLAPTLSQSEICKKQIDIGKKPCTDAKCERYRCKKNKDCAWDVTNEKGERCIPATIKHICGRLQGNKNKVTKERCATDSRCTTKRRGTKLRCIPA